MTARNWFYLFTTTLLWGGFGAVFIGGILFWGSQEIQGWQDWLMGTAWNFGAGLMFSIASQMGFFAFLFVRQIMTTWLKKTFIEHGLQLLLVAVGLFDLFYLRFRAYYDGSNYLSLLMFPLFLLLVGLLVAAWKSRLTNGTAFVPALFYMVVFTLLEGIPVIMQENHATLFFMFGPLLICNAWQILQLHRLTGPAVTTSTLRTGVSQGQGR